MEAAVLEVDSLGMDAMEMEALEVDDLEAKAEVEALGEVSLVLPG